MSHPQPHAHGAAAVGMTNVVAAKVHVVMLAERGEEDVVLERKMTGHDMQVNARFMSSCVSNARRNLCRAMTKTRAPGA
jgi:hypothetical protein